MEEDTPEHWLVCQHLNSEDSDYQNVKYEDIFSENLSLQSVAVQG